MIVNQSAAFFPHFPDKKSFSLPGPRETIEFFPCSESKSGREGREAEREVRIFFQQSEIGSSLLVFACHAIILFEG